MTLTDLEPSAATESFEVAGGGLSVAAVNHLLVVALTNWCVAICPRPVCDEGHEDFALDAEARCIDVRKGFDTSTL